MYYKSETGSQGDVGPFLNYVNLIDCSFSTTNENDVILGQSYVGPILPLVQRPPKAGLKGNLHMTSLHFLTSVGK